MRERVLHVVDSLIFGGAEQAILTLLRGTDDARWQPSLACHASDALAPLADGARDLGVDVWTIPSMAPGFEGIRRLPAFVAGLRRRAPDVVHLHLTWPLGCQYPQIGAFLARTPGIVATVQLYVDLRLSRRVDVQQRFLTRIVDRYIAVSNHVRMRLASRLGWAAGKIDVVHNAVEPVPSRADAARLRRELGGDERTPLVLHPARLLEQKAQRDVLRAAAAMPGVRFLFAGDGPDRAVLEAASRELGVADRVTFLGRRRDVRDLMEACDVVVLPSRFEGLPVALLEAMAAGRPVVATRIGGVEEVVTPDEDGILVEPGDAPALAGAIHRLLTDVEAARRIGAEAARTIRERFSAGAMCRRVMEIYADVLGR